MLAFMTIPLPKLQALAQLLAEDLETLASLQQAKAKENQTSTPLEEGEN